MEIKVYKNICSIKDTEQIQKIANNFNVKLIKDSLNADCITASADKDALKSFMTAMLDMNVTAATKFVDDSVEKTYLIKAYSAEDAISKAKEKDKTKALKAEWKDIKEEFKDNKALVNSIKELDDAIMKL